MGFPKPDYEKIHRLERELGLPLTVVPESAESGGAAYDPWAKPPPREAALTMEEENEISMLNMLREYGVE